MTAAGTCRDCKHSRQTEQLGGKGLFCHCNPPQFVMMPSRAGHGQFDMHGLWPPVVATDHCGHWTIDPMVRL